MEEEKIVKEEMVFVALFAMEEEALAYASEKDGYVVKAWGLPWAEYVVFKPRL